jgi:uncharacterized protein
MCLKEPATKSSVENYLHHPRLAAHMYLTEVKQTEGCRTFKSTKPASLQRSAGIGLRTPHSDRFLNPQTPPVIPWLEALAENYFDRGGIRHQTLCRIAERYPISVHGVALSLGSPEGIVPEHLERLSLLVKDVKPHLVSEHLAWSRSGEVYYNNLLPLPLTEETLDVVSVNIDRTQDFLGRMILIENPSGYLSIEQSTMSEAVFLTRLTERTGCGLLLDVNNLFISEANLGISVDEWLSIIPPNAIGEIHLAGHEVDDSFDYPLLIDTHGVPVTDEVWTLYAEVLKRIGPRPTMIEWDSDIPSLEVLLYEAAKAQRIIDQFVTTEEL